MWILMKCLLPAFSGCKNLNENCYAENVVHAFVTSRIVNYNNLLGCCFITYIKIAHLIENRKLDTCHFYTSLCKFLSAHTNLVSCVYRTTCVYICLAIRAV